MISTQDDKKIMGIAEHRPGWMVAGTDAEPLTDECGERSREMTTWTSGSGYGMGFGTSGAASVRHCLTVACVFVLCTSPLPAFAQEEYPDPPVPISEDIDAALSEIGENLKAPESGVSAIESVVVFSKEGVMRVFASGGPPIQNYSLDAEVLTLPNGTGDPMNPDLITDFVNTTIVYHHSPGTVVTCGPHLGSRRNCTQTGG